MEKLQIFCVTNKKIDFLKNSNYKIAWVGKEEADSSYIKCNYKKNIFYKEKYYSELTFHYWFWKNLMKLNEDCWVGFCQKRRFWINPESEFKVINKDNLNDHLLINPQKSWSNCDSVICKPIDICGAKKMKIIKRGWRTVIKNPLVLFDKNRQNIKLHFDMHHGYGNIDKAIKVMDNVDKEDFYKFINTETSYNPHIMFISKPQILNKWFTKLFDWLERCESEFDPKKLQGYDTTRLYAYLAERYLSFWFKKNTKYYENPWIFIDN